MKVKIMHDLIPKPVLNTNSRNTACHTIAPVLNTASRNTASHTTEPILDTENIKCPQILIYYKNISTCI